MTSSKVYVTNFYPYASITNTVQVINTSTNAVVSTITVGSQPLGVAITPDGTKVYVANDASATVSVINTATNAVIKTITLGTPGNPDPIGVAVSPDGSVVFISSGFPGPNNLVYVIATATDTVTATINIGNNVNPWGVAFTPDGSLAYVARQNTGDVAVIDPVMNTVMAYIPTGAGAVGVAVTPDGSTLYVRFYPEEC
jgi:YVTN family beta-propeller protein